MTGSFSMNLWWTATVCRGGSSACHPERWETCFITEQIVEIWQQLTGMKIRCGWACWSGCPASLQTPTVSGKNAFLLKHQSIKDSKLITQTFIYLFFNIHANSKFFLVRLVVTMTSDGKAASCGIPQRGCIICVFLARLFDTMKFQRSLEQRLQIGVGSWSSVLLIRMINSGSCSWKKRFLQLLT